MRTHNAPATQLLEQIMAALKKEGVLKPDKAKYPVNFNAAYTAVRRVLSEDRSDDKVLPSRKARLS
jgi:hypothetical protein